MRVGFFKRAFSFFFDAMPIIFVLTLIFQFLVGDMLKPDDYDQIAEEYNELQGEYLDEVEGYLAQFEDGEIDQTLYDNLVSNAFRNFNQKTMEHAGVITAFLGVTLIYYVGAFTSIYYAYSLITKGNTLGRKVFKIELKGKINWWTLLVREVLWKCMFYALTFIIGGLIIDIISIGFGQKKQAARDYITRTRITPEGVDYPF